MLRTVTILMVMWSEKSNMSSDIFFALQGLPRKGTELKLNEYKLIRNIC